MPGSTQSIWKRHWETSTAAAGGPRPSAGQRSRLEGPRCLRVMNPLQENQQAMDQGEWPSRPCMNCAVSHTLASIVPSFKHEAEPSKPLRFSDAESFRRPTGGILRRLRLTFSDWSVHGRSRQASKMAKVASTKRFSEEEFYKINGMAQTLTGRMSMLHAYSSPISFIFESF